MGKAAASPILHMIRRAVEDRNLRDLPDRELVERFHGRQDHEAFHALLRRHGPLVLDVCRGVLGNEADSEDAFQATFLILARKAGSIRKKSSLASWLHGVAYRTALKARAQSAARQKHEAHAPARATSEPEDPSWREVRQALHEEVSRLPERFRAPLLLCYLEGATQEAAAVRLSLAKSTLREHLERGRALLRTRLLRRGLGPAAVLVAAAWPATNTWASVPPALMASTVKAARLFAAGQAAAGVISAGVAALTEGVMRTMLLSKIKLATAVALVVAALGIGVSGLTHETLAADEAPAASKSTPATRDEGNIKETVLALEDRIWEAHRKQDVNTFKNLLADDYLGLDIYRRPYTKSNALDHVSKWHITEYSINDRKVILLNASSAIVTYEVRFKYGPADAKNVQSTVYHNSAAWAKRNGRWWAVFAESLLMEKDGVRLNATGAVHRWKEADSWQIIPTIPIIDLGPIDTSLVPRDAELVPAQKIELIPTSDGQAAPRQKIGVRLPSRAETNPALDKIVERLGLAGQLAKINAANTRYTKEDVIPIVKQHIEFDVKNLKEAKGEKAVREALQKLEESVQMLKELLSSDTPKKKQP